ncbi:Crp/Fnr family transcriptional regulator [Reichenbachiella versicolor]|uniref:Crp/Fnr family transcriptional regulator n=1 Tax=Reichenbachiella versicolor TaxID=1821036 RepID=UPI000D6E0512|nr:Crp/Fnr family transcriptional regulator [Reichenbachiella versicolor]
MVESLIEYIKSKVTITEKDVNLVTSCFAYEEVSPNTSLLKAGNIEQYIYFLKSGIVKGYQSIDGKIVIQHLIAENNFFVSLDSFMTETGSLDFYETITDCKMLKISKADCDYLNKETEFWSILVKKVTNEHLSCKMERVKDFQTLTARERYIKFLNQYPKLALNVSIDNIASFLGMEPQSLSRIRKQIAF